MLIAHLPAGYLATHALSPASCDRRRFILIGMVAAVCPDLDMLCFYLVDRRQHFHHDYWTHVPVFWLTLTAATLTATVLWPRLASLRRVVVVAGANVMLHLVLDSFASRIRWLYPWSRAGFGLFDVPARHGFWVTNFFLHWTMLIELLIAIAAVVLLLFRRALASRRGRDGASAGARAGARPTSLLESVGRC